MPEYLPMSMPTRQELLQRFAPVDDPKIEARRQHILDTLLEQDPKTRQRLIEKGREDGDTRIEACADLATLERWLDQAVTAASASDALA